MLTASDLSILGHAWITLPDGYIKVCNPECKGQDPEP